MNSQSQTLWTIEDVADYCRVKPSIVKYWTRNTNIPYIRLGKHIRFEPEKLREWIEEKCSKQFMDKFEILKLI